MPTIAARDLDRMRDALLFEGPAAGRKLTRFWALLVLSAMIATAGVVADSTATVIGAMIVAPLMTPILGIVLSVITADRINLLRSVAMVVSGAALVIAVAFVYGLIVSVDIVAATSSQVDGRVSPRLVDLMAALATGAVGAFALVREDVSDTLPGVAIAISLVPPLAVVGLTLEAGSGDEARGALLLFLTNVAAILASGVAVMALYRVNRMAEAVAPAPQGVNRRGATAVIVGLVALLAIPLAGQSIQITRDTLDIKGVTDVANRWAEDRDWRVLDVQGQSGEVVVRASGPLPSPEPADLRRELDADGLGDVDVVLELVPEERVALPAS